MTPSAALIILGIAAAMPGMAVSEQAPVSPVANHTTNVNVSDPALSFDFKCMVCHWGAEILVEYQKKGKTIDEFLSFTSTLCHLFGIESKEVCAGMVRNVGRQLFTVLAEGRGLISADDICGLIREGACAKYSKRMNGWALNIPDLERKDQPVPPPKWPSKGDPQPSKTQKILHISDPHIQRDYKVGTSNTCGEPVANGRAANKKSAASYFGDYHCDLPPWIFDDILNKIKLKHPDIDYIFLTGDYPAHDVWRQNRTSNLRSMKLVTDVLEKHFPSTKVFPTIGNHESFPVNMFPMLNQQGNYSIKWLYSSMADYYKTWLPGAEQQKTLREGGYYTILARPGLRILSLNTNFCNNLNFWLLLNFDDPQSHLHWIYHEMHKAETNREKVYIIGHIPPGRTNCYNRWSHEYNRIVKRFNNTILGQFMGHTHFDEFEVFFGGSGQPISTVYLAPSLTPHDGINPAYRLYTIDASDASPGLLLDHSTFYFDLEASIRAGKLLHRKEYAAREKFRLENLSPEQWQNFVLRMVADKRLFTEYLSYYYRSGPASRAKCGKSCRRKILCHHLTSESGDSTHCTKIDAEMTRLERLRRSQSAARTGRRPFSLWSWAFGWAGHRDD